MQDETLTETLSVNDEEKPLPEGWRLVRLGDVCYQSRRIVEPQTEEARKLKYLSLEHVESETGKILSDTNEVLEDEGKSTTFYFNEKHVLYGKLRPYLNKVSLPNFEGRCTTEIIPLLPNENAVREYLALILRRGETVNAVMKETKGSRMPRADVDVLLNLKTPFPPTIEEQRRIASILDEQMKAVEQARLAVEEQLEAADLLPNAFLRSVFESEEAKQWKLAKVGNISLLIIDGPHVTPFYVPNGVPFLTVRNIVNRRIDFSETSFITDADHQEFTKRGKAERGDILYTKDGTLGIPCVVDTDREFSFFVSVALIKLNREMADPYFIAFALESPFVLEQVKLLGAGMGLKHMVLKSIRSLEIPLPSTIKEQREVVEKLKKQMQAVETLKKSLTDKLEAIKKLPAALLRKAFAGEI